MTPYSSTKSKNFNTLQGLLSKGLLSLSFLCFAALAMGQAQRSLAAQAAQLCQEKALEDALAMSTAALADPAEGLAAYTWYVHGFVCKEIYKANESHMRNSLMRKNAIAAFITAESKQGPSEISTNAPLRYLLATLHNDALMSAGDFTLANEWEPDSLFSDYQRLAAHTKVHSAVELHQSETQFLKAKAQHYFEMWNAELTNEYLSNMAIRHYSLALEKTPDDCISVYNIGVAYYDQAVLQSEVEGMELADMTRLQIAHSYFSKAISLCGADPMIQAAFDLTSKSTEQHKVESHKKLAIKKK